MSNHRSCHSVASLVGVIAALWACVVGSSALAQSGRYSQIVVGLSGEKKFKVNANDSDNTVSIEIEKTSTSDLSGVEHYDESMVRRIVLRDMANGNAEIKMVLRDKKVKATVTTFNEPFRISIDLFDENFKEKRDPQTGMPLAVASDAKDAAVDGPSTAEPMTGLTTPKSADRTDLPGIGKKRLILQQKDIIKEPNALVRAMDKIPGGIGKAWAEFPIYIYRIQTVGVEMNKGRAAAKTPAPIEAVSSTRAMGDFAGKEFDFGNEARALAAYEQVLYRDPRLFDEDPLALWKFAESHLGQGNYILADGYFQALMEKHPAHPLARFAAIRHLDILAIRAIKAGQPERLAELVPQIDRIRAQGHSELLAQIAIRRAYWIDGAKEKKSGKDFVPAIDTAARGNLSANFASTDSAKTAFLAQSLLLSDALGQESVWQTSTAEMAKGYFERFSGPATEPIRSMLQVKMQKKVKDVVVQAGTNGKSAEAIAAFESLPKVFQVIAKDPAVALALAESYRSLGRGDKAVEHFAIHAQFTNDEKDRFRSQFWLAYLATEQSQLVKVALQNPKTGMAARASKADQAMAQTWGKLSDTDRRDLYTMLKDPMEKTVGGSFRLVTPAKIILAQWNSPLSTKVSTQNGGDREGLARAFSPTAGRVALIQDLAKRFSQAGLHKERLESLALLKQIKPSELKEDKKSRKAWAEQLMVLAEEHRKGNDYLEAGRIYALTGSESVDWDGRAESLYKGGLLLFRAGRRDEAKSAFKKASEDGNNLYYANLAKERLSQMDEK